MPVTAEKYVEMARAGERLTAVQRRLALTHLKHAEPELTVDELAQIFRVSSRQIKLDRQHLRKASAQSLIEDDVILVISDMKESVLAQIRDLEKSKKNCKPGTRDWIEHCKAIADLELKLNKMLQDLGLMPKNLGTMTVNEYHFEARVGLGGHTEVHRAKEFDPDQEQEILEGEFEEVKAKELTDGSNEQSEKGTSGSDDAQVSADTGTSQSSQERGAGDVESSTGPSEAARAD